MSLREEDQDAAPMREGDQRVGICQAAGHVVALDERYFETPQERACNELPEQFSLGNDRRLARKNRSEDKRIDVTGVIEHQRLFGSGASRVSLLGPFHGGLWHPMSLSGTSK